MRVEDSTLAVVRALKRMGVRHYVGGSLASSLHGEPRADVQGVVIAQRTRLDLGYLKRWAAHLGVSDLLERLLAA